MMYIHHTACISPQQSLGALPFEGGIVLHRGNKYIAREPDYSGLISKGQLRRMGKFSRLGIGAGARLVLNKPEVEGILISTANGGLENCVKFLDQLMKYEEGTLTPTNFVQSTPNSVSGTLALMSGNNRYNITHVGIGLAFEASLLDALLLIEEQKASSLLVGSVEEISEYNYRIDWHRGFFKDEEVSSEKLLSSNTKGSVSGEGATMFVVNNQANGSLAAVRDVSTIQTSDFIEMEMALDYFLSQNELETADIDCLILGMNGDVEGDVFYHKLLESKFKEQRVVTFKNLVGEYPTASGFALWLASQQGNIPNEAVFRQGANNRGNILIYNHYYGKQHGFTLVNNPKF